MKWHKIFSKYRVLAENFFSLSLLNMVNVLLPLVILPYLMRVIGKANYGIYNYVYVVIQYVILFATYGFSFSATKQISKNRTDRAKVNGIYNAVIVAKLSIAVVVTTIVLLCRRFIFRDEMAPMMFLCGLGMVVGDVFTPVWLFQGMERMRYMTIVNVSSKVVFTLLIFIFVHKESDYTLLLLLNSCGYIVAAILSILLSVRQFGIRLGIASYREVWYQIKEGSAVFGSTLGMNLYRNANVIILKQFVPNEIVGIYSAAEKVIKGCQSVVSPAAQALFPFLSLKFKDRDSRTNIQTLKKIALPFTLFVLALSVGVYLCAPLIVKILCAGEQECIPLIRIMTLVILFGEINYLIGIVGLVNMNYERYFLVAVVITGVISVTVVLLTVAAMQASAAAMAMSVSEIILFLLCLYKLVTIRNRYDSNNNT